MCFSPLAVKVPPARPPTLVAEQLDCWAGLKWASWLLECCPTCLQKVGILTSLGLRECWCSRFGWVRQEHQPSLPNFFYVFTCCIQWLRSCWICRSHSVIADRAPSLVHAKAGLLAATFLCVDRVRYPDKVFFGAVLALNVNCRQKSLL